MSIFVCMCVNMCVPASIFGCALYVHMYVRRKVGVGVRSVNPSAKANQLSVLVMSETGIE